MIRPPILARDGHKSAEPLTDTDGLHTERLCGRDIVVGSVTDHPRVFGRTSRSLQRAAEQFGIGLGDSLLLRGKNDGEIITDSVMLQARLRAEGLIGDDTEPVFSVKRLQNGLDVAVQFLTDRVVRNHSRKPEKLHRTLKVGKTHRGGFFHRLLDLLRGAMIAHLVLHFRRQLGASVQGFRFIGKRAADIKKYPFHHTFPFSS